MVQRLRAEWESHPDRYKGKTQYSAALSALSVTFDKEVAAGGVDEIQQYVQQVIAGGGEAEFPSLLESRLISNFVSRGERQRLVDLLAAIPEPYESNGSIEQTLTRHASPNALNDGLLVLFDAYDAGKSEEAKAATHLAAWRALGDAPLKTTDRDAYMRAARSWYATNRDRLERCKEYDRMDLEQWKTGGLDLDPPPCHLFTLKPVESR